MRRLALVFPGQGAQAVGMGRELYERFPESRAIFSEADATLDRELARLCFEGPAETLQQTENAQPAILVVSVAALAALRARYGEAVSPAVTAGHSLGEFTALVAAGALDFATALRLVAERGRLMGEAGRAAAGRMCAVLGLDIARTREICEQAAAAGTIVIANDNAPGQIVLSGASEAIAVAERLAKEAGARRVLPLAVSGAFHSPLMAPAAREFAALVAAAPLRDPIFPIVANTTARPLSTAEEIRLELQQQLTGPVRWTESVRAMGDAGVGAYVEVGPGAVLAGLIKRAVDGAVAVSVGDFASVEQATKVLAPSSAG